MVELDRIKINELFVIATNRCNLTCRHCYVSSSPNGHFGLSVNQILKVADDFHSLFGRKRLTLSGGEIFMRRDLIESFESLAKYHDLFILTNGTLVSEKKYKSN